MNAGVKPPVSTAKRVPSVQALRHRAGCRRGAGGKPQQPRLGGEAADAGRFRFPHAKRAGRGAAQEGDGCCEPCLFSAPALRKNNKFLQERAKRRSQVNMGTQKGIPQNRADNRLCADE